MHPGLTAEQAALVESWLPGATLVADLSWGLVDTVVLHVRHGRRDLVVKAAGADNHHLAREIAAHRTWVPVLARAGRAVRLRYAAESANVLVTTYLPGHLVQGTDAEWTPDVYLQAGRLLARLHGQAQRVDHDYETQENAKSRAWLDGPHRIARETEAWLRSEIATFPDEPVTLVPTHGDFHPRNWLVDGSTVHVIDFGRAAWRPADTDLARIAGRQLAHQPELELAFLEGYGSDPRTPELWRRTLVREAIGTACWAHQVGDSSFEAHGHRLIASLRAG